MAILTACLCYSFAHPFYLSVTDLKYNSKEKLLECSVRIFANDLENCLSRLKGKRVDLIHPINKNETGKIAEQYLRQCLNININGKKADFEFLGFEIESEACWIYLQFPCPEKPRDLEVDNSILYDFLTQQSNIVQCDVEGNKQNAKVNFPDKHLVFKY